MIVIVTSALDTSVKKKKNPINFINFWNILSVCMGIMLKMPLNDRKIQEKQVKKLRKNKI